MKSYKEESLPPDVTDNDHVKINTSTLVSNNELDRDIESLSDLEEDLSIGENLFYIEEQKRQQYQSARKRKIVFWLIFTQVKCLVISFSILMFLIATIILSIFLWNREDPCDVYLEKLHEYKVFEMNAEDFWPKESDSLGNTYGTSRFERKQIFAELKKIQHNLNSIFLQQRWSQNLRMLDYIDQKYMCSGKVKELYYFFGGPWDITTGEVFFSNLDGSGIEIPKSKLPGGGMYPDDITKEEFETWIQLLSPEERKKATSFYTRIIRNQERKLLFQPFSEAYKKEVNAISASLIQLSSIINNPPLQQFLNLKASALLNDEYEESDIAWVKTNSSQLVDITIGPYETYEDELFGYKATFEAFVSVKDEERSTQLREILSHLQFIEDSLPIDAVHKNPKVATSSSISVVNLVMNAGDAAFGIQTAAYNLPNDPKITEKYGSRRILLKNVQEAKFEHTLVPLIDHILASDQRMFVNFDAFFTQVMAHEIMHGLGPHAIQVNGKNTTVRETLREFYSPLEEAKADISGLFMLLKLIDDEKIDLMFQFSPELKEQVGMSMKEKLRRSLFVTYLVSIFRSARFGSKQAHGQAVSIAFNYLQRYGGIVSSFQDGKFTHAIQFSFIEDGIMNLVQDIMTMQALGDYEGARAFFREYAPQSKSLSSTLQRIKVEGNIPIDIKPRTWFE